MISNEITPLHKPPGTGKQSRAEVEKVISHFEKEFTAYCGKTPLTGGKERVSVVRLLKKGFTPDQLCEIITTYSVSKKRDEYGLSLMVALSDKTINLYHEGKL